MANLISKHSQGLTAHGSRPRPPQNGLSHLAGEDAGDGMHTSPPRWAQPRVRVGTSGGPWVVTSYRSWLQHGQEPWAHQYSPVGSGRTMLQQLWRQGPWLSEASPISQHMEYLPAMCSKTQPPSQPRSPTLTLQDRAWACREPVFNITVIL